LPKQDESGGHDLLETKQRLSAKLMPLDFISGVGIAGSKLVVYVVRPLEPEESKEVREIVDANAPGRPFEFVTTGVFKKK
jgi:hypothetical protein